MKWQKPGHEYDETYRQMNIKTAFYLYGAGDYGKQFVEIFRDEINILGYIDNNPAKHGTVINGYMCRSFSEDILKENVGIIITMSQIARVSPIKQLTELGYERNKDFFIMEDFLSVYHLYKYDKVYFSTISFLPSTVCNLKCRHCLNFNPFAKKFYVRNWEQVKADIDLFFQCIDKVMLFHVSGGEPLLYNGIGNIIEYLDRNYHDRIDTLRTVTNGTIVPDDSILEQLSRCNIEVTVDDYREAVPQYKENFDKLLDKLKKYNIKHYVNYTKEWVDLAPEKTDFSHFSPEQLIDHFDNCCQSWQELRDGKLYSCNYDAYATVAGINEQQDDEIFDLKNYSLDQKAKLVEFRLGYNKKGYTNFCKRCRGFSTANTLKVKPAVQG
ncbi:MAG: radical SAM protein [Selenomonadaceae bacterium]|nr:radical SAM protein [Selenomonadaceae bacterium]